MPTFVKNVLVVGSRGCGKTCLFNAFVSNSYDERYVPTSRKGKEIKQIELDGVQIELHLTDSWDNAINDGLGSSLSPDVILLCFAIDAPDTLQDVEHHWYPVVQQYCSGVPIVLVGNMKDLRHDSDTVEKLAKWREALVSCEAGKEMVVKMNATSYVECSAKTGVGVQELFEIGTRAALKNDEDWRKLNKRNCCNCAVL